MKDALNHAYGFGCHCRNCTFKEQYDIDTDTPMCRCLKGVLKPEYINNISFCSEGVPRHKQEVDHTRELTKNTKPDRTYVYKTDLKKAITMAINKSLEKRFLCVSIELTLLDGTFCFVSFESNNPCYLRIDGLAKERTPKELWRYMDDNYNPCRNVPVSTFLKTFDDKIANAKVNIWNYIN